MFRLGWKVVAVDRTSSIMDGKNAIHYKRWEWVYPKEGCGPLAVFKGFKHAWAFTYYDDKIIPCLYEQSEEDSMYLDQTIKYTDFPQGTVLARRVKCLL